MAKSERRTREQRAAKAKTSEVPKGAKSKYAAKKAAKVAALQLPDDPLWRERQRGQGG